MTITVNGDTVTIADNATVADLMAERHLTSAGTAVAVNAAVCSSLHMVHHYSRAGR